MTKQEAYERLELPQGADLQEVRRKFAELYNDYRMRIDNAPTARMRQTYEQHLEAVKEAYALLNESDRMDDTGDLPRTAQSGTFEEGSGEKHLIGDDETAPQNIDRALAVFGLSVHQPAAVIARMVRQHLAELHQQYMTVNLPAAKAAYQQEITKAEAAEAVIRPWLATRHAEAEPEGIPNQEVPGTTQPAMLEETSRQRKTGVPVWLIGLLMVVALGGGYWWWSGNGRVKPVDADTLAVAPIDSAASDSTARAPATNSRSVATLQKDSVATEAIEDKTPERAIAAKSKRETAPTAQAGTSDAQRRESNATDEKIYETVEVEAVPPGGIAAFTRWVGENYAYPAAAIEAGVNGRVEVSFVVDRDGSLTDFKVVRHIGFGTGEALIETLRKSPKWTPGQQNGRPVRVAYTLPIRLNLTE